MLQRREVVPVIAALLVLLGVVVADAATPEDTVLVSLLVTAPLLAAAFTRPGVTAVIGVVAVALAAARGASGGQGLLDDDLVRVATILASSTLAVFIAARREQRESALLQMTVVADVAQNAVLWPVPEQLGSLRFAARYVSASAAARIGGDLYEVVESPHGVRIVIGDVRGKGLPAVRLATAVLGCFREVAHDRPALGDVQRALNTTVERLASPEDFVTATLIQLDGDCGQILSCGHPPPLLVQDGEVTSLDVAEPELPLGLGSAGAAPTAFVLGPGTRMLLHTDGLLEARDGTGTFFPVEEHLQALADAPPEDCLDALLQRVADHCGGHIDDDVALLLVERSAVPSPPVAAPRAAEGPGVRGAAVGTAGEES